VGLYFGPAARKWAVKNVLLYPFHIKPRQQTVSLESPGLENITQVPANRAEVDENHDARKADSVPFSVLKWSWSIFRHRSSKKERSKSLLCPFHCKPWPSKLSWESPGLENIHKFRKIEPKLVRITMRVRRSRLLFQSSSEVGLYFGPETWKWAFKKFACVHFTAHQSHQELV